MRQGRRFTRMVHLNICVSTECEFTTNASDIKAAMLVPIKGDKHYFYSRSSKARKCKKKQIKSQASSKCKQMASLAEIYGCKCLAKWNEIWIKRRGIPPWTWRAWVSYLWCYDLDNDVRCSEISPDEIDKWIEISSWSIRLLDWWQNSGGRQMHVPNLSVPIIQRRHGVLIFGLWGIR